MGEPYGATFRSRPACGSIFHQKMPKMLPKMLGDAEDAKDALMSGRHRHGRPSCALDRGDRAAVETLVKL